PPTTLTTKRTHTPNPKSDIRHPSCSFYSKHCMDEAQLRALMEQVREGSVDVDAALSRLRHMPFEDLGFAKVDHHRALRQGMPEVIFGTGKSPDQVVAIATRLLENAKNVLVTRADPATADSVAA